MPEPNGSGGEGGSVIAPVVLQANQPAPVVLQGERPATVELPSVNPATVSLGPENPAIVALGVTDPAVAGFGLIPESAGSGGDGSSYSATSCLVAFTGTSCNGRVAGTHSSCC